MIHQTKRLVNSLILRSMMPFSRSDLINVPPAKYADHRQQLKQNVWRDVDKTHKKSMQTHGSNGQYLIHKIPVVYTHSSVVRCIGGTQINTGHPQVYIQLNTKTPGEPVPCKWCGIRYALDTHHHDHQAPHH